MKTLKKIIVLTILLIGFTAKALTVTDGAIVGKMIVNKRPTVVNELITVNYVFLYKSNKNTNIQIKLEYPTEYLSAKYVVSLPGKPNPACQFTTSDVITCYNVEHSKEQLITVMYKVVKTFDTDKKISASIKSDYEKVKFSTSKTDIVIPKVKAKDGSFIKVSEKYEVAVEDNQSLNYELIKEYKDKKLTFTSSDPTIVTVDKDGILTGVKEGTAKVTIAAEDDQKTVEVKVTPKETPAPRPTVKTTPIVVEVGTPITKEDVQKHVELPKGAEIVEVGEIPTTETPGQKTAVKVKVKLPTGEIVEVEVPVTVTPKKETPTPRPEKPSTPEAPKAPVAKAGEKVLPNTGIADENSALAGLGLAILGLAAAARRRKQK